MKVEVRIKNENWIKDLQEAAMNTINKKWDDGKEMTPELFRKYIISEHSPIRGVELRVSLLDISYYNSVHIARHVNSIPYVTTSRPDRTGKDRSIDDTVNHLFDINIQGLIDMSRKRLCSGKCDKVTFQIMLEVKKFLTNSEDKYLQVLGECLVPNCIYRGGCPEFKSCGFDEKISHLCYDDYYIKNRYSEYNKMIIK
jgi:hypothetical protein